MIEYMSVLSVWFFLDSLVIERGKKNSTLAPMDMDMIMERKTDE